MGTCGKGETCVVYWDEEYKVLQSCQICDVPSYTTLEAFNSGAPTNEEPPADDGGDDGGDGGDDGGDGDDGGEPEEPAEGEEINTIDGVDEPFICLNARAMAYTAGAAAATMVMLY